MSISRFGTIFFVIICAAVLAMSIRGLPGNPDIAELNTEKWRDNGPFELSPERGRFALLYSLLENNSFSFSREVAFFSSPDVAYQKGRYVSLFAPGLSFIVMPGYLIGQYFGASQFGTFAVVSLFALGNLLLILMIAKQLGAHPFAALLSAFGFLFATPAYAYAVNLYQHHISTFLILLCCFLLLRFQSFWSLSLIWLLCVFSVVIDYPNFFMLLPIGLFAFARLFLLKRSTEGTITITLPLVKMLTFISVILPILFFCWVNMMSYGKPFQLAGELERPLKINEDGSPVLSTRMLQEERQTENLPSEAGKSKGAIGFFVNRNMIDGFYTHFISMDRGMLIYTPIMFFAIVGLFVVSKKTHPIFFLFIAIIGVNILLYSMWGDPYGGWAFGSRYLIPSYALLSIFIAIALTHFRKSMLFLILFFVVLIYSIAVNTLGAITTSRNPPKVEIASLEKLSGKKEEYTFMRNAAFLTTGQSKSFVFQSAFSRYIPAWNYYLFIVIILFIIATYLTVSLRIKTMQNRRKTVYEI